MSSVRTVILLFACIMLCACEHKELCLHTWQGHNETAKVRVDVDWSNFEAEVPTGMTLTFFNSNMEKQFSESTNDIYSYTTQLPVGTYNVGVVNQSPDELYTVVFQSLDTSSGLDIMGTNTSMPSFIEKEYRESVKTEPQEMACDVVYDVVVPQGATETIVVQMVALPILYTVDISVEVSGYARIQRVYGVLSGVADGYNGIKELPITTTSSYEISEWSVASTDSERGQGLLTSSTRIFGISPVSTNTEQSVYLKIYMLLRDGKTFVAKSFPVGNYFKEHTNRHYSIYISNPLELPEISNTGSTSAGGSFDAEVSEWGEEINLEFK